MSDERLAAPDDAEQAARVKEAFAEGEVGEARDLLDRVAAAIRDRAWAD